MTHRPQAVHDRVEQGAEDAGPRDFELTPKLALRTPLRLSNGRQGQKNRPVPQIRPADHLLDAVQEDRACCFKQHLLIVGVELPYGEAAAGGEAAEGVGEPVGQAGQIVEREQIAVIGGNHQLALLARERPHRGGIGIDQRLEQLGEDGLGRALLARYRQKRDTDRLVAMPPTARRRSAQSRSGSQD